MLEDAAGIRRVVLACGTVDLRKGIDGLAAIIGDRYGQNPFEKGTLFLFCGKRSDLCKGLLWMVYIPVTLGTEYTEHTFESFACEWNMKKGLA